MQPCGHDDVGSWSHRMAGQIRDRRLAPFRLICVDRRWKRGFAAELRN